MRDAAKVSAAQIEREPTSRTLLVVDFTRALVYERRYLLVAGFAQTPVRPESRTRMGPSFA